MRSAIGFGFVVVSLLAAGCGSGGALRANDGLGSSAGGDASAGGATGGGGAAAGVGGATAGVGGATGAGGAGGGAAGGGDGGDATWLTTPPVAPALVVPAGATLKIHVHATGAQIYTCTAGAGGADGGAMTYAWVLKAPDARLYDSSGVQVGTHGAGPEWTASDGSVAHGTKVTELPSPLPDAISWLLLRVSSTSGAGAFSDVSYVQRLSTIGGRAPATGCDAATVGADLPVGYTAEYYFYTGGAGADWLAPPANLPDVIAAPGSVTVKLHDHGIGVQIYACLASNSGGDAGADSGATTYAWVLKAPNAILYDMSFVPVATHGEGPSWTSSDLSTFTARALAQVDSPLPDAIPWVLLKEFSESGAGEFSDIAIVQRVNTAGGKAPASGCDATTVNTLVRVPYSADYYFYADFGGAGGAGGGGG